VSTIIGTSARSQPGNTFNMAGKLAKVGVRTRNRCRFLVRWLSNGKPPRARLLGARDRLAGGLPSLHAISPSGIFANACRMIWTDWKVPRTGRRNGRKNRLRCA